MRDIKLTLSRRSNRTRSIRKSSRGFGRLANFRFLSALAGPRTCTRDAGCTSSATGSLVREAGFGASIHLALSLSTSTRGERQRATAWRVRISDMELASRRLPYRGFKDFVT